MEAGKGAVLVVYKLDRLGRSSIDLQEALAVLHDAGVRVVSLADGVDSASGMGAALLKLLTSILSTFAEMEKEAIRVRLLDGRKRADAENRVYASEPRYGRRVSDGKDGELETDEEESERSSAFVSCMPRGVLIKRLSLRLTLRRFFHEGHLDGRLALCIELPLKRERLVLRTRPCVLKEPAHFFFPARWRSVSIHPD